MEFYKIPLYIIWNLIFCTSENCLSLVTLCNDCCKIWLFFIFRTWRKRLDFLGRKTTIYMWKTATYDGNLETGLHPSYDLRISCNVITVLRVLWYGVGHGSISFETVTWSQTLLNTYGSIGLLPTEIILYRNSAVHFLSHAISRPEGCCIRLTYNPAPTLFCNCILDT